MGDGRVIPETRSLRHDLPAAELADLGQQLSRAVKAQQELTDEKAEAMAEFNQRVKAGTARINELANALNSGYEMREVHCHRIIDFDAGIARIKRLDTGEIIEERPLLDDERQMVLEVGRATATETIEKALAAEPLPEGDGTAKPACTGCGKIDVEIHPLSELDEEKGQQITRYYCLDCLADMQKAAQAVVERIAEANECTEEKPCCDKRGVKHEVGQPAIDCVCDCHESEPAEGEAA